MSEQTDGDDARHDHGDAGHTHHDAWQDPRGPAARAAAFAAALVDRGLATEESIAQPSVQVEDRFSPLNGARVVARAWVDAAYRARLLADGSAACAELGFSGPEGARIVAVENTPALHNVIVCTLCSCYPWPILGLPPDWYKSPAYRARVVREPRAVLREFGLELGDAVAIRVWDSTADTRYLVLPMRPAGVEGLDEAGLAALVTRDSMIGTGLPQTPPS